MKCSMKKYFSLLLLGLSFTGYAEQENKTVKSDFDFMQSPDALKGFICDEIQKSLGFINPFEILENSEEYKDEIKSLEKELDGKKAQLKSIEETAMKKKTELETMGHALSDSARERKREELVNLEAQYRIKLQSAQEYAQGAEEKARMRILKKIQDEAELLAKEEGRIMVVAGGVIYGAKPIDLTQKVLTRLNKKYRAEKEKKKVREEAGNRAEKEKKKAREEAGRR